MTGFRVGAGQVDITPPPDRPVELSGFVARVQPAAGVHDSLFARALYVESAVPPAAGASSSGDAPAARLLWLHADLIGFEQDDVRELQRALHARLGLTRHEICVTATHTHSGPATIHLLNCGEYDPEYVAWLQERLLEVAAEAVAAPEPAEMVIGEGRCELAIDRRGKPAKHTDPRVGVLGWRRCGARPRGAAASDGRRRESGAPGGGKEAEYVAVLANYGIHHVALGHENRLISADMAGRAAARIAADLPGRPVVLFTNGGAGNVNPPAVANDFVQMEHWGDQLAAAVLDGLASASLIPGGDTSAGAERRAAATEHCRAPLRSLSGEIRLPEMSLTTVQIEELARQRFAGLAEQTGYIPDRIRSAVQRWRGLMLDDTARRAEAGLSIQVISLGPVMFACFGAEVFSVAADELRARLAGEDTPAGGAAATHRVFVVSYANGDVGYLAPRSAHQEGGYETASAFVYYGRRPAAPGGFELALDKAAELLKEADGNQKIRP